MCTILLRARTALSLVSQMRKLHITLEVFNLLFVEFLLDERTMYTL